MKTHTDWDYSRFRLTYKICCSMKEKYLKLNNKIKKKSQANNNTEIMMIKLKKKTFLYQQMYNNVNYRASQGDIR